jgi:fatty-acyl-CoA synthase
VVTIEPFHGPRVPGSTGLRLPFTEVRAFRNRSGQADLTEACAPGETGIIALRGPNVSPGYSDPALNAGTFEGDGWLVSGDLGHVDASGRVFITGRAKDVIIRGAHNIDPATIEDALLQHPAVAVAAAVGQIDAYAGELPVAFVTLKTGAHADEEAIRTFVAPLVPEPAAHPKRVWIMPELPLTPVGKIYKPALKALAARHAIEERLGSLDPPAASEIAVADGATRAVVRVAGEPGSVRRVKEALLGLPIECEVTP